MLAISAVICRPTCPAGRRQLRRSVTGCKSASPLDGLNRPAYPALDYNAATEDLCALRRGLVCCCLETGKLCRMMAVYFHIRSLACLSRKHGAFRQSSLPAVHSQQSRKKVHTAKQSRNERDKQPQISQAKLSAGEIQKLGTDRWPRETARETEGERQRESYGKKESGSCCCSRSKQKKIWALPLDPELPGDPIPPLQAIIYD